MKSKKFTNHHMMIVKKKLGAEWFRQMLFDKVVQRSLSKTYYKRLNNQNSDNSLQGLVIDWHLANTERIFDIDVEPVVAYQPTYAYA